MKEIVTGPLESISSSNETDSTESELQLQSITATTSQQDFVRFNVPKRIATASQVVAAADRHRISNNALNDILVAFIRESDGDVNDFVLSKASTLRGRKEVRELEFNEIEKNFKSTIIGEFFTVHWDEKLLKQYGDMKQTSHIAVLSSNGSDSKLLGTTSLDRGTGLQQAQAIKNMLDAWEITELCVAMCFDTTAANTSKFSGACVLLEAFLGRSLLWTACRHHIFEVVLSQVFKDIFGDSASPSVELFQQLKNWQLIDFTKATSHLDPSTSSCSKEDIEHANRSLLTLKTNSSYLLRDDYEVMLNLATYYIDKSSFLHFSFRRPGTQHRARWMSSYIYSLKVLLLQNQFEI